ncbi:hypothetical protein QYE76_049816 [Lolium multiflorum]|uniref:Uncharacterized protein n=1 Tax=Lolium multiflorum TaxID=4521 RepID=A0AAD8WGE1_LOLMU|nr:hypothetical protein QYE76_049816 [Lolium multiflorum]
MAESTPVKYEDLADKLSKRHNKVKAENSHSIGSCGKTRSRGIKLDGDTRPLPDVNTVDLSHSIREPGFSFDANMAGFVIRHDADKAESSHSRGKEKEEAVPRDRPQDDDKRYLAEEEWDGDEVEVVHADDSAEISTAGMGIWETSGQEPLSGINLDDCERIDVTKNGVRLVLSTGLTV